MNPPSSAVAPPPVEFDLPLYFKSPGAPPPAEDCAYLMTGDGLFLHRRHRFFESCVPVPIGGGPASLERQKPFLRARFPRVPRALFRRFMGFARELWRREGAEVIAFFTVAEDGAVDLLVPEQTAIVQLWRGDPPLPVRLGYRLPDSPPGLVLFGDIHSHGSEAAYASRMDVADEQALTGLHLVVGRLDRAHPEFHVEATVDGFRFSLPSLESVLAPPSTLAADTAIADGAPFPREWERRVEVRALPPRDVVVYGAADDAGHDGSSSRWSGREDPHA